MTNPSACSEETRAVIRQGLRRFHAVMKAASKDATWMTPEQLARILGKAAL